MIKRCGKNGVLDPLLDPQTEDLRGKIIRTYLKMRLEIYCFVV